MRNTVSHVKVELPHNNLKGDHIPHEQEYNTRHGLQAIPDEVHRKIRCQPRQPEVQQKPFVHLLLKQRWDGSVASLACQSRRPHSHPNQHTEAELKLIRDMRRRNPTLGMLELWTACARATTPAARKACSASCASWACSRQKRRKRSTPLSPMNR